jgi:hypothetical protein
VAFNRWLVDTSLCHGEDSRYMVKGQQHYKSVIFANWPLNRSRHNARLHQCRNPPQIWCAVGYASLNFKRSSWLRTRRVTRLLSFIIRHDCAIARHLVIKAKSLACRACWSTSSIEQSRIEIWPKYKT